MIRLMLVDGYAAYLQAFAEAFERTPGFRVTLRAGSLAEAARGIGELHERIDVALVGSNLPDGDGGELRPHLHGYFPGCHLVLYGVETGRRAIGQAIAVGAAGAYPVEAPFEQIVDGIKRLVAGESMIPRTERAELLQEAAQLVAEERAVRTALSRLTPREWEILESLAHGLSDKDIAARFGVSTKTVAAHMANLLKKLGVESRLQAVLLALRFRVIGLD